MNKSVLALLVVTFFLTGQTSIVLASGTRHHHPEAVSPFGEDTKQEKSLRCLLNKHRPGFFCPHEGHLSSKNQGQAPSIAPYCGGGSKSNPATLNLLQELSPVAPTVLQSFRFDKSIRFNIIVPAIHKFHLLDVQYPPPRFI